MLESIMIILLTIILSPVILIAGLFLLFVVIGLVCLLIMAIVMPIAWIIDLF